MATLRQTFKGIADAIRAKGASGTMTPLQFPEKIAGLVDMQPVTSYGSDLTGVLKNTAYTIRSALGKTLRALPMSSADMPGHIASIDPSLLTYVVYTDDTRRGFFLSSISGTSSSPTSAIANVSNAKNVTFGRKLTAIGDYAFNNCKSLLTVTVPETVIRTGSYVFSGCTSLDAGYYLGDLVGFLSMDLGSIFWGHSAGLTFSPADLYVNGALLSGTVVVPDSITVLGRNALRGVKNITGVVLHNGITSVGDSAFQNLGLTELVVPDSVVSLGASCCSTSSLRSATIGNGTATIGSNAFSSCTKLTSVSIGSGITSIGTSAFTKSNSCKNVSIGRSVSYVQGMAKYPWGLTSGTVITCTDGQITV